MVGKDSTILSKYSLCSLIKKQLPGEICYGTGRKMKRSASKNTKNMASKDIAIQSGGELIWTPLFMQRFARELLKHPILLPNANTDGLSKNMLSTQKCIERRELYDALNISKFRPWTTLFLKEYKRMLRKKLCKAQARTTEQALSVLPEWVRDFEMHFNEIPKTLEHIRSRTDASPGKSKLLLDILSAMWKELKENGSEGHELEFWTRAINAASKECGYPQILVRRTWCSVMKVAKQKLRLLQATGDRLAAGSPGNLTTADWLAVDLLLAIEPTESLLHQDCLTDFDQLATLTTLLSLAQMFQLDECLLGTARDSEKRWKEATQVYIHRGYSSSMLVLQRRWCELVQLSRSKLAAFQRGGGAVPPLCKQLAIRFPQLVTSPLPAWRELVASRRVALPDYADEDARHTPGELAAFKPQTPDEGSKDDDIILIEQDIETIDLDGLDTDDEDKLIIDERIKLDKKKLEQRRRLIKEEKDTIQSEKNLFEQRKKDICNRLDSEMDSQLEYINDSECSSPSNSTVLVKSAINWDLFNKPHNFTEIDLTESDSTDGLSTLASVGDNTLKTEIKITEHNVLENVDKIKHIKEPNKEINKTILDNDNRNITVPAEEETTNPENMTPNLKTLFAESSAFTNIAVLEELDPSNVEAKIIFSDDENTLDLCDINMDVTSQEASIPKKQDELVTQQVDVKQENIPSENKIIPNDACIINLDTDGSDNETITNKINTEDTILQKGKGVVKNSSDSTNIPKPCPPKKKRIGPKSFLQKFKDRETKNKSREKRDSTDDSLSDILLLVDENNGLIPAKTIVGDNTKGKSLSESGIVVKKEITSDKVEANLGIVNLEQTEIKTEPNVDSTKESGFKKNPASQSIDNDVNKIVNKDLNLNKDKLKYCKRNYNKTKTVKKSSFARFSFEDDKDDLDEKKSPNIPMETNKPNEDDNNDAITASAIENKSSAESNSNDADANEIVKKELNSADKIISDKAKNSKPDDDQTETIEKAGIGQFSLEGENSEFDANKQTTSSMETDDTGYKNNTPKPDFNGWVVITNKTSTSMEIDHAENKDNISKPDLDGWVVIDGTNSKSSIGEAFAYKSLTEVKNTILPNEKCERGHLFSPVQIPLYKIDALPFWRRHSSNNTINITKITKNLTPVKGRRLKPGFRPTGWPKIRRKSVKRLQKRYHPRDLRKNPDFIVGMTDVTGNVVCNPVTVDIERLPIGVLEEYLEKQNISSQGLPKRKKVELADIDEVRRINKRLLTAQVRPILAKKRPSRELSRCQSAESDSDVSFVMDVEPPRPPDPTLPLPPVPTPPLPPAEDSPDVNMLTLQQLEETLDKLTEQESRRASAPSTKLYCCPARRHINYNRAKARIAARAGKHAVTVNMHAKLGPHHAELKCECCCVNVLRGLEESRMQLHNDMKALHSDLRSLAQMKNDENLKDASASEGPPAKLAKPTYEDPDYTPEELPSESRKNKEKRAPKRKEANKRRNKHDKNKSEKQEEAVETNEYDEWMRQRNICAKYFTMGSTTSPAAKRPKTSATVKVIPPELTKETVVSSSPNVIALNENITKENVLTADEILDVVRKREAQNINKNTENNDIEIPIGNSNAEENQQEWQIKINNIAEEHSYIKSPRIAIQAIPKSLADTKTQNPLQLTIEPMTSQQHDIGNEDPMKIILNDKQPLQLTPDSTSIMSSESTLTASSENALTPSSESTLTASSENTLSPSSENALSPSSENTLTASSECMKTESPETLSLKSRSSSLEHLSRYIVPRSVINNTNTQDSKDKPTLVVKESTATNSQTHRQDSPRYVLDESGAHEPKIIPFSVYSGSAQKTQTQVQVNEIQLGHQVSQTEHSSNQKTNKTHIVTHVSGQAANPTSKYWNNAITQPQIKTLIETAQLNPGLKIIKVLQCSNKSETILATCVAKKEDPNQTTLRLVTQRSNPLMKQPNVEPECIDLTDNDEPALPVNQVDSSSQVLQPPVQSNQPVKSIAQVSQLIQTLGHDVPLNKNIKVMGPANNATQTVLMVNNDIVQPANLGPAKQSVETLGQPIRTVNPSNEVVKPVQIVTQANQSVHTLSQPVQTQANQSSLPLSQTCMVVVSQANKMIPPGQAIDESNKLIAPVQSVDGIKHAFRPIQSISQANKPIESMTQANQNVPSVQTKSQANQIVPPVQTKSQANQIVLPVQTKSQANQIVPPVQTKSQANQIVPPVQTKSQANQIVPPVQTKSQANQIVPPVQTKSQAYQIVPPVQTNSKANQIVPPVQTKSQANQIVPPVQTKSQANQIVPPVQTKSKANQIVPPVQTKSQANQIVPPVQTKSKANQIVPPVQTKSQANQIVSPVQTKSKANQIVPPVQTKSKANQIVPPVQTKSQANQIVPPVQTKRQANQIVPPVQTKSQANQIVPPVQTRSKANQIVPPVQTKSQANEIVPPVQTKSKANQIVPPVRIIGEVIAQMNEPVHTLGQMKPIQTMGQANQPILGQGNQMVHPFHTIGQAKHFQSMGQANQPIMGLANQHIMSQGNHIIVQPIQTMGQANQPILSQGNEMVQPIQTMGQANQIMQQIQTMGQANQPILGQGNQMVQPIQTMGQANQPILGQGNQMVQPFQTMGQANQIMQQIQTIGQANQPIQGQGNEMVQPIHTMGQANQMVQTIPTMNQTIQDQMIQAVQAVEQMIQQAQTGSQTNQIMQPVQMSQANSNIQPGQTINQSYQSVIQSTGQPNQIIENVVYGNIVKPVIGQPIELGIQTTPTTQPMNQLTSHFIPLTLNYQLSQPAQTSIQVSHGPMESQTPRMVLNIHSSNNAGKVSTPNSTVAPIILNEYLNTSQIMTSVPPPWIKNINQTVDNEDDKNTIKTAVLSDDLKEAVNENFMRSRMPFIKDVFGNYDIESNTELVPTTVIRKPPMRLTTGRKNNSPPRIKVLSPKTLAQKKLTIGNHQPTSESQEQMQQSLLEMKLQMNPIPLAQPQATETEERSFIRKKQFESTDLSYGSPQYVEDIVKYILASKMSLSAVKILAVNTTKPLLKLKNQYLVVTEAVSTHNWLPSFWTLNPPLNFNQIYFTKYGKSPPKVKTVNLDAELSKEKATEKGRLKVRAFAKLPGTGNALTLNENIEVRQGENEQNKLGKLLMDAQDFMYLENKCFKKLSDDPLIYAQVFSVLSDVCKIENQAVHKEPLYLLDIVERRLNPIQRREACSEERRVIDLVCPGTKGAMKDLVKLMNTTHDDFGFPRQKLDIVFTSLTVDVTSLGVDTATDVEANEHDVINLDADEA